MAAWVDLSALHNPSAGTRPPASWGDGINSNMSFLSGVKAAEVLTSQTTTSTSYTDLATVGPSVTVDTGTNVVCIIHAQFSVSTSAATLLMSVAVSGATTVAASDQNAFFSADAFTNGGAAAALLFFTGLTAGTNIFTMKYKVSANTGTFLRRRLLVIPLTA